MTNQREITNLEKEIYILMFFFFLIIVVKIERHVFLTRICLVSKFLQQMEDYIKPKIK